jgi:hypothetical protein
LECLASTPRRHVQLRRRARSIDDPPYRRGFLEDVPVNARTLALARAWLGEPADT